MRSALFALTLFASPVAAQDLIVQFNPDTSADIFTLQNSGCELSNAMVLIDLKGSKSDLMFGADPTALDAPARQPVEITHGYGALSPVRDGDRLVQIFVRSLAVGDTFGLSAAFGESLDGSAVTQFSGTDLAGASLHLALSDRVVSATFDAQGQAKIQLPLDASVCLAAAD